MKKEVSSKEIFSKNLRHYIEISGKNIPQISKEAKITHSYLYELINPNNGKMPSINMIEKLAAYFEIEVSELLKK